MQHFLGSLTLVLAVAMVFLGLTSQIRKNYKEKQCGWSLGLAILVLSVYLSRAAYAVCLRSFYIFIPDFFGSVFATVILIQSAKYRRKGL